MQMLYELFYRQYGLRRVQNLLAPRIFTLNSLPRDSMIHFLTYDEEHPDIDASQVYYEGMTNKIYVDYPEELKELKGAPRRKSAIIRLMTKPFHRNNKKFFYLPGAINTVTGQNILLVYNYNYLDVIYRYTETPLTSYYKWWNIQKTMWDTIAELAPKSSRNHFVFVKIPEDLPSLSILRMYEDKINPSMLKIFSSHEEFFILELWKWLSKDTRDTSVLGAIKAEDYNKVNIVFQMKDGRSCLLNLGYFNSWIKGETNTTEFTTITALPISQMQKLLLKFVMTLQASVPEESMVDITNPEQVQESPEAKKPIPEDMEEARDMEAVQQEYDEQHDDAEDHDGGEDHVYTPEYTPDIATNANIKPLSGLSKVEEDKELTSAINDTFDITSQLNAIDADIVALDKISKRKLKEKGIHIDQDGKNVEIVEEREEELSVHALQQEVFVPKDVEATLRQHVDDYADYGLLTASDYKKFMNDIDTSMKRQDPYGSGTSAIAAMEITKDDIVINREKTAITINDNVLDASMLQSSLLSFDQDYLNNVIKKDMLSMVHNLQKAGVVVKKHEIEVDHSALGSYENHMLELKPVDGVSSTVRFRVPQIAPEGTFIANNNKYILRKQKIDAPIRKIDPITVALTSYYGKTFVALSAKKANNSVEWLVKQLNKASMEEGAYISRVAPGMVFDNNFKAPYIYNALAHRFKSIDAGKFHLIFDHTERQYMVKDDELASLEKDGSIVAGIYQGQYPIVLDTNNTFTIIKGADQINAGDIYDILQLQENEAPVDFAEIRIFSKTVPIGVVLAYSIGLQNLIKLLDANYRVVEARKNKNLEKDEYAISFQDMSLIFSRKNKVASIILSGFNEFDRQLKQFAFDDFNQKDVYLNLLESKGLGSLYIREMELTQQLFVDPITKSILEEMKEPVTFNGLLMRAAEMLQTYHHPDSQDMTAMRVRGYERIPGVIYKEMVAAIRQYRNRNIAGKSKIDISPYQVWTTILKDPAIKLVEDINPIQNLKESEIVTYVGEGGRSKESMNKASRAYHPNDIGVVSEATVDSSDVGINAYLSADPKFKDLRGIISNDKKFSPTSLLSTSALLAPGASGDDPKRVFTAPRNRNTTSQTSLTAGTP